MNLTREQLSILQHTSDSNRKVFCGEIRDPDLCRLVDLGYLRRPMKAGFIPATEGYFYITLEGENYLSELSGDK